MTVSYDSSSYLYVKSALSPGRSIDLSSATTSTVLTEGSPFWPRLPLAPMLASYAASNASSTLLASTSNAGGVVAVKRGLSDGSIALATAYVWKSWSVETLMYQVSVIVGDPIVGIAGI